MLLKYFGRYYWSWFLFKQFLTNRLIFFHQNLANFFLRYEHFFSFVGKFTWGKTRFCGIFRKVTNTSRWKLKLDINHLKKYLIWNFHLVWPAQFREWSVYKYAVMLFIIRFSRVDSHNNFKQIFKKIANSIRLRR